MLNSIRAGAGMRGVNRSEQNWDLARRRGGDQALAVPHFLRGGSPNSASESNLQAVCCSEWGAPAWTGPTRNFGAQKIGESNEGDIPCPQETNTILGPPPEGGRRASRIVGHR